jgi:hypothetical protein
MLRADELQDRAERAFALQGMWDRKGTAVGRLPLLVLALRADPLAPMPPQQGIELLAGQRCH